MPSRSSTMDPTLTESYARRWTLSLRLRRVLGRFGRDRRGITTLEWALLLAAIAIPSLLTMAVAMNLMVEHYRMMTALNALPFP
ncbi:MAG: hypothetical protein JJU36_13180 [Phycisphaeraceae bacterium]|nr:hypothetical protein [Phycisphaeraceae bacterium]